MQTECFIKLQYIKNLMSNASYFVACGKYDLNTLSFKELQTIFQIIHELLHGLFIHLNLELHLCFSTSVQCDDFERCENFSSTEAQKSTCDRTHL